jgi:hypothetical protein
MPKLAIIILVLLTGCTSRKYQIRRPPVEYNLLRHSVEVCTFVSETKSNGSIPWVAASEN